VGAWDKASIAGKLKEAGPPDSGEGDSLSRRAVDLALFAEPGGRMEGSFLRPLSSFRSARKGLPARFRKGSKKSLAE